MDYSFADYSLFVGDLAPDVSDMILQEYFRQFYPSVRSAKVRCKINYNTHSVYSRFCFMNTIPHHLISQIGSRSSMMMLVWSLIEDAFFCQSSGCVFFSYFFLPHFKIFFSLLPPLEPSFPRFSSSLSQMHSFT